MAQQPNTELKKLRKGLGLSQQDLAVRAGCSIGYVRTLEGGYTPQSEAGTYQRVLAVLAPEKDERHLSEGAAVNTTAGQGRHESA